MSDSPVISPATATKTPVRPVSLFTIAFVFALLAAFFFLVRYYYAPAPIAPYNAAAENLPKDLQWRATAESRRATLSELKQEQAKRLNTYGWVDQKAGIIRLPIEQAMQLTVAKYGTQK